MTPHIRPHASINTATMAHHASPTSALSTLNAARGKTKIADAMDVNAAKVKHASAATNATTPTSFRAALDAVRAMKPATAGGQESPEDAKLRATAEQLVNQLFMGTMLKQMRSSPFKDSTMSGGKAGDAYAGLFDQNLAAKAGGGMGKGLVDVMVKHLKRGRDGDASDAAAAAPSHALLAKRRDALNAKKGETRHAAATVDRAA